MRIAIVGAGALGSLFGALLARSGQEVWLYNRSFVQHVHAIRAQGLTLQTSTGELNIPIVAVTETKELSSTVDLVGIFVKAYDTEQAIRDALPLLGEQSWVLSLQNGIGPEEILARYLPKQRILRGVTAQGATLVEPGVIRWAGQGSTRFGSLVSVGPPAQHEILQVVEVFRQAGIEAHNVERVEPLLWEKLLINAAINPLTALFGIPNGVLLEDSALRLILREVVSETRCIVASHGVQLSSEQAMERVEGVCRATAENLSSMLQDVQRGKRTEIDFINGVVVREGERLGIATPLNRLLTQLVLTRSVWKTPAGSGEQQCV